jgi:hypothetical protein
MNRRHSDEFDQCWPPYHRLDCTGGEDCDGFTDDADEEPDQSTRARIEHFGNLGRWGK